MSGDQIWPILLGISVVLNLLLLLLQIADFFAQAANRRAYFASFKLICLFAALYLHLISFTGHLKSLRSTAKVHCPVRAPLESRNLALHLTYDL